MLLTKELADDLMNEHVNMKSLDDILDELRTHGTINMVFDGRMWETKFLFKSKDVPYEVKNQGKNIHQLVKSHLALMYFYKIVN